MADASRSQAERIERLRGVMTSQAELDLLDDIARLDRAYEGALGRVIALRRQGPGGDAVAGVFEGEVQPARDALDRALMSLSELQEKQLQAATGAARETVSLTLHLLIGLAGVALLVTVVLGIQLSRALRALEDQREELARHTERIEEVNRELDAFAGRVSHDLRNLLSPIAFAAATLRRSTSKPAAIEPLADRIQRGVDRSISMIEGLLAFSRSARPEPFASSSIAAVVEEVLEQVAPLAAQVGATLESSVEDTDVACSRELLNVVALNLVGNALKFLEGRDRRWVRVSARRAGRSCELTVEDSGPGIPEDARARIFEPFYRVPGTRVPGVGIGLATVRRIVDAHGGQIDVGSVPSEGTTVRVRLPLAGAAEAPLAARS
jgi:signal transduction histidine kinase